MTPEQILDIRPKVLSQGQREQYFADGFLVLPGIVPEPWVSKLRAATEELVERSRAVTRSDAVWDLEPGHSAATPRLRRVTSPVAQQTGLHSESRG